MERSTWEGSRSCRKSRVRSGAAEPTTTSTLRDRAAAGSNLQTGARGARQHRRRADIMSEDPLRNRLTRTEQTLRAMIAWIAQAAGSPLSVKDAELLLLKLDPPNTAHEHAD